MKCYEMLFSVKMISWHHLKWVMKCDGSTFSNKYILSLSLSVSIPHSLSASRSPFLSNPPPFSVSISCVNNMKLPPLSFLPSDT